MSTTTSRILYISFRVKDLEKLNDDIFGHICMHIHRVVISLSFYILRVAVIQCQDIWLERYTGVKINNLQQVNRGPQQHSVD